MVHVCYIRHPCMRRECSTASEWLKKDSSRHRNTHTTASCACILTHPHGISRRLIPSLIAVESGWTDKDRSSKPNKAGGPARAGLDLCTSCRTETAGAWITRCHYRGHSYQYVAQGHDKQNCSLDTDKKSKLSGRTTIGC